MSLKRLLVNRRGNTCESLSPSPTCPTLKIFFIIIIFFFLRAERNSKEILTDLLIDLWRWPLISKNYTSSTSFFCPEERILGMSPINRIITPNNNNNKNSSVGVVYKTGLCTKILRGRWIMFIGQQLPVEFVFLLLYDAIKLS